MFAIKDYRLVLSSVFKSIVLELSFSDAPHDLIRSLKISAPVEPPCPPSWNLNFGFDTPKI